LVFFRNEFENKKKDLEQLKKAQRNIDFTFESLRNLSNQIIQNSYSVDSPTSFEIKQNLATRQFICKIFEYSHSETSFMKLQCLNKRFYLGILPNWLHESLVFNIRFSEGEKSHFFFPDPGYFSVLSNKEKLQVRLDGIALISRYGY
jgi:hypothetical protein